MNKSADEGRSQIQSASMSEQEVFKKKLFSLINLFRIIAIISFAILLYFVTNFQVRSAGILQTLFTYFDLNIGSNGSTIIIGIIIFIIGILGLFVPIQSWITEYKIDRWLHSVEWMSHQENQRELQEFINLTKTITNLPFSTRLDQSVLRSFSIDYFINQKTNFKQNGILSGIEHIFNNQKYGLIPAIHLAKVDFDVSVDNCDNRDADSLFPDSRPLDALLNWKWMKVRTELSFQIPSTSRPPNNIYSGKAILSNLVEDLVVASKTIIHKEATFFQGNNFDPFYPLSNEMAYFVSNGKQPISANDREELYKNNISNYRRINFIRNHERDPLRPTGLSTTITVAGHPLVSIPLVPLYEFNSERSVIEINKIASDILKSKLEPNEHNKLLDLLKTGEVINIYVHNYNEARNVNKNLVNISDLLSSNHDANWLINQDWIYGLPIKCKFQYSSRDQLELTDCAFIQNYYEWRFGRMTKLDKINISTNGGLKLNSYRGIVFYTFMNIIFDITPKLSRTGKDTEWTLSVNDLNQDNFIHPSDTILFDFSDSPLFKDAS